MSGKSIGLWIGKIFLALFVTGALALPLSAQDSWPPISQEDLAMLDCPQQPGAAAICLIHERTADLENFQIKVFSRLKILTAAGRDHANIEIPYYRGTQLVTEIEARVVPPNSSPQEFTGEIFEKTAFRGRGIRVYVKAFALPDVEPGSIIDYRYKIVPDPANRSSGDSDEALSDLQLAKMKPIEGGIPKAQDLLSLPAVHWEIQGDLFIRSASFEYISYPNIGIFFGGPCRLGWVSRRLETAEPVITGGRVELQVENIPAFEAEDFMTPEDAERISVDVFYLDRRISSGDDFWRRESQSWQKSAENFIGNPRKLAVEVKALLGDIADPAKQLEKIYTKAQDIRNLSYEKTLTRKQKKEQGIKDNRRVTDVLERNYGLRSDITRTFVALARAAGFEADVARVSTRDDKMFRIKLLTFYDQLDSEIALVKLGEKTLLFDPATPFCPFGLIHWSRSNTAAVRFSTAPPEFFTTSSYSADLALTQRELVLQLDPQGSLAGTVKTTYTGHEALVRRLDAIHDDPEEIRKSLEEELAGLLPIGAGVTMTRLDNIDNSDPVLIIQYDVTIPGLVTLAGDRMLLPATPLLGKRQHPFRHTERKFPVYFPYPFREFNDVVVTLPEGVTAETRPEPRKSENDFSSYTLVCAQEGPQKLHIQRDLVLMKGYFPVEQYPALKAFYDNVRTNDEEQFVLGKEKK